MRIDRLFSSLLVLGLALGCGEDDPSAQRGDEDAGAQESDDETSAPNLPKDKLVSELTAAEGKRLCAATLPQLERIEAAAVSVSCYFDSLGSESCADDAEQCLASDAESESSPDCDSAASDVTGGEDCMVTVAQFQSCFDALVKSAEGFAKTVDCETELESIAPASEPPKVCTDIASDCSRLVMFDG